MSWHCTPQVPNAPLVTDTDTPTRYNASVSARPSPAHFYLNWLKVVFFKPFGPAPVIFGVLTVLGAVTDLLMQDLLGELTWLLWVVPLSVFLLFLLLGLLWAPWIMHQEQDTGASRNIKPPRVTVSTRIEEPVQAEPERAPTRVKQPAPVEKGLEAKRLEKTVQVQRGIPTTPEEPFIVETFSSPFLRQMEDYFEEQGEAVAYPRLAEKEEHLAQGFQVAFKPGTRQEVWITYSGGDHIMMLKPK